MKRYRLSDLPDVREGHFLSGILPDRFIMRGGIGFKKPGAASHMGEGPGGADVHVHLDSHEVFVFLQGKAVVRVDGKDHPAASGDVFVIEPGEDHHIIADRTDPCINLWLEPGPRRSKDQEVSG